MLLTFLWKEGSQVLVKFLHVRDRHDNMLLLFLQNRFAYLQTDKHATRRSPCSYRHLKAGIPPVKLREAAAVTPRPQNCQARARSASPRPSSAGDACRGPATRAAGALSSQRAIPKYPEAALKKAEQQRKQLRDRRGTHSERKRSLKSHKPDRQAHV